MSSSFKFLNNSSAESDSDKNKSFEQEDAAQSFLNEKLDKNRFTIAEQSTGSKFDSRYTEDQIKELDANGGPTVGTASGDNPDKGKGTLAERYQKEFGTDAMSDLQSVGGDANAANAIYANIRSLEDDKFWKNQDLSSLMAQAGHQDHQVMIGDSAANGGLHVNASIANGINFDSIEGAFKEKWGDNIDPAKSNAIQQLGGSMLLAGGDGTDGDDIELSPEIQQAKERVRTYEDDVLSGKTSEDIYGGNKSDKYQLDLNKGADGIGTFQPSDSKQAASSFLDNKKAEVKDKYQFKSQR